MSTIIEKSSIWSWCEEPNYRAPLRAQGPGVLSAHSAIDDNGQRFIATGAGSATTIVCTALTEATAAGYGLTLVRCTGSGNASSIENVGVTVLVRASNGGGTLTTTAFPAATASGDQFEMADVDCRVVETTGGSATQVVSALRINATQEPNDFWNGYYLVAENVTNTVRGTAIAVTDFIAASGTFLAALSGNSVIGDVWFMRKFPRPASGPLTIEFSQEDLPRSAQRGALGEEQTVPGARSWSTELAMELKGSGTAAGAGTAGVPPPEAEPLLRSIFERRQSTGTAVAAAAGTAPALSTLVFDIATESMGNFPVGSPVHDAAGRAARVVAVAANGLDPDSVTVRPAFNRTPIAGEVIRGGCAYAPKITGHTTLTMDALMGRQHATASAIFRWIGWGGVATVKIIDFARGKIPKLAIGIKGGYWMTFPWTGASVTVAQHDTVIPRASGDGDALIVPEGIDTITRLTLDDGEIDFGMMTADEIDGFLFDGQYGGRILDSLPVVTLKGRLDLETPYNTHAEFNRYYGSRVFTVFMQHGHVPGKTVSFYAHRCSYLFPALSVADGLRKLELKVKVLASDLTDMPVCDVAWT